MGIVNRPRRPRPRCDKLQDSGHWLGQYTTALSHFTTCGIHRPVLSCAVDAFYCILLPSPFQHQTDKNDDPLPPPYWWVGRSFGAGVGHLVRGVSVPVTASVPTGLKSSLLPPTKTSMVPGLRTHCDNGSPDVALLLWFVSPQAVCSSHVPAAAFAGSDDE